VEQLPKKRRKKKKRSGPHRDKPQEGKVLSRGEKLDPPEIRLDGRKEARRRGREKIIKRPKRRTREPVPGAVASQ